ncbi:ABC transporter substrate-binding protein [Niallia oryzisoli]|uniref:ABC transporter substrate-binding protein n=1 Tax=Niallia oryzisoli TaxID=1737571 RepID=A0ABZ2CIW0_9BACI
MKRITSLLKILPLIAILFLAACSGGTKEASNGTDNQEIENSKIRLGIDAGTSTLPFRVAEEKGFFKEQGLEPTIATFPYGIDTINALFTEQTDTGYAADYALINSLGKGDLVILGTMSRSDEETSKDTQLLVKGSIESPQELKGKHLGVAKGTVYEYIWAKYLKKYNINEKDVTYVPFSTPDEAIVGMKNGDIDAVWTGGALAEKFKAVEGVKQLDNLNGAGVSIDLYLVASRSYAEQNPQSTENALKALSKGIDFTINQKEEAAKIAFDKLKLPEKDVLKDLQKSNYVLGFTKEDYKHLEDMKKWIEANKNLENNFKLEDKLYLDPLKKAFPDSVTYK